MSNENTGGPDPYILLKLLRYVPETGKLFWRHRTSDMFSAGGNGQNLNRDTWNNLWAGKTAFETKVPGGYLSGAIFNKRYLAHRVIWAMQTGAWPEGTIDHEDHNGCNNVMGNMRDTTQFENTKNQTLSKANSSGITGVSWDTSRTKWSAQIQVSGRKIFLGYFVEKCHAAAARSLASVRYGFHKNHGRSPIAEGRK